MKTLTTLLAVLTLAACSGGGGGNSTPRIVDIPLDGVYRASPVIVSANDVTYDYEIPTGNPSEHYGTDGRVYRTTVTGNNISGTASIYRTGSTQPETGPLTGTVTANGALALNFSDGPQNVSVNSQRLAATATPLIGRAWCTIEFDSVTVHACAEFDVLNNMTFTTPTHGGPRNPSLVSLTLTNQIEANVYEATIDWEVCGHATGVVGFADHQDGVHDEMVINVVGGPCGYLWWIIIATK